MLARKVVVGLSGGVDSAVSALLLRQSGKFDQIEGVFMKNWDNPDESGSSYSCPQTVDLNDAYRVAKQLDIKLHVVDFVKDYWTNVFQPYIDCFEKGTPNPDVFCNREIKFKRYKQFVAEKFGDDAYVATGHYARLKRLNPLDCPQLLKGVDKDKDQSYFLCAVSGDSFRNVAFPVGDILKSRVREIAKEANLCNARKKDSVGICFVGKRRFPKFINNYMPTRPGRFVCLDDSKDLGPHRGLDLYTVGQCARIGGLDRKHFVARKDMQTGDIYVVSSNDHLALFASLVFVKKDQMFWVAGQAPEFVESGSSKQFSALVRYRQESVSCFMTKTDEHFIFDFRHNPVHSVTPQQIVALYDGEVCLGGGVIDNVQTIV